MTDNENVEDGKNVDRLNIRWRLYEGEMFGVSVIKGRYIPIREAETKFGKNIVGIAASTIVRYAKDISQDIDRPIIIMMRKHIGSEECYKIIFPEGGSLGCESVIKRSKER